MLHVFKFTVLVPLIAVSACSDAPSTVDAPNIQSNPPIIYLADNLDEEAQLGWCIDTKGRGFSETLHAHSCKPQNAGDKASDINFRYDAASGQIQSTAFAGKCAVLLQDGPTTFGLLDCNDQSEAQKFTYDAAAQMLHPSGDTGLCLTVGSDIAEAGPFQSRALLLADCNAQDAAFKQWVVLAD